MRVGVSALLLRTEGGFQKAGICRYIIRMLDEFAAHPEGDEFVVFVPDDVELAPNWLAAPHLTFERVVIKNRLHRVWWEHTAARQWVRLRGLDVWFSTAQCTPFACGAPRATMVHDLIPIFYPQFFSWEMAAYQKWTIRHSCRAAELVMTSTQSVRDDIVRTYGTPKERIAIAPLGPGNTPPPVSRDQASREVLQRHGVEFERYLFTLSTLEPRKNLVRVFEALKELKDDPGLGFVVGGAKGWKESDIFERLRELGVENRVKFLGYVDDEDLPHLFARAEAFVYASIYEGFGIPVLEAMLMGTPVVASRQAALVEVGGEVARYFEPNDPVDIARAIRETLSASDREERIAAGFARAKQFGWAECSRLTREAISRLVQP